MFILLLLLWVIFNGRVTGDVLLSGIAAALLVCAFCYRYMDYNIKNDLFIFKNIGKLVRYFLLLLKEMVIANLQVMGYIMSPKKKIDPCIIYFQPDVKTVAGRVLLANTITLIPGSVTGEMSGDGYIVHALTPEIAKAQQGSKFEEYILEMEGES